VERYRDPARLLAAIPHSDRLTGLPRLPFVGQLSYGDLARVLRGQRRWWSRPERVLADTLAAYLDFKLATVPSSRRPGPLETQASGLLSLGNEGG
jgi:hypothetical protein